MRYVIARKNKEAEQEAFRTYITDAVRNVSENIAAIAIKHGGDGKYIATRYADIIHPKPEEKWSAEEIIGGIKAKLAK